MPAGSELNEGLGILGTLSMHIFSFDDGGENYEKNGHYDSCNKNGKKAEKGLHHYVALV